MTLAELVQIEQRWAGFIGQCACDVRTLVAEVRELWERLTELERQNVRARRRIWELENERLELMGPDAADGGESAMIREATLIKRRSENGDR